METESKIIFEHCEKCGKRLIERLPNGMLRFLFGKKKGMKHPVDIKIFGSIKMACLRTGCDHIQVINYFPEGHPFVTSSDN